jgi:hypothetical protein
VDRAALNRDPVAFAWGGEGVEEPLGGIAHERLR